MCSLEKKLNLFKIIKKIKIDGLTPMRRKNRNYEEKLITSERAEEHLGGGLEDDQPAGATLPSPLLMCSL